MSKENTEEELGGYDATWMNKNELQLQKTARNLTSQAPPPI